jgi:hypothetical protein
MELSQMPMHLLPLLLFSFFLFPKLEEIVPFPTQYFKLCLKNVLVPPKHHEPLLNAC